MNSEALSSAIAAAETAEPRPPLGEYPGTYDNGATIQLAVSKALIPSESLWHHTEVRAMKGMHKISGPHYWDGCSARRALCGCFSPFAESRPREWTTHEVAPRKIVPDTAPQRCRFVETLSAADVGPVQFFISHTWSGLFCGLMAGVRHIFSTEAFVWIDTLSVGQWPSNHADLDFEPAIRKLQGYLLILKHTPEIALLSQSDAFTKRVPDVVLRQGAFWQIWCVVELATGWRT